MIMRCMLNHSFPTAGESNAWIRDESIGQKVESVFETIQPEAVFFYPVDAAQGGYLILNPDEASEIPPMAEPFFLTRRERRNLPCDDPRGSGSKEKTLANSAEVRLGREGPERSSSGLY